MMTLAELLFRTVDGVFVVDDQQHVVFWDAGCAQLFGRSAQSVLGRRCCEVVRGKDPSGQPFCGGSCCIARLSVGANAPGMFPLRVHDGQGQEQRLAVSIVLVPSLHHERWYCVHLLRRAQAMDPLATLANAAEPFPQTRAHRRMDGQRVSALSAREREIVRLLAEGMPVTGISRLLKIRAVTVRNHLQHIRAKLGVHSQAGTVAYAYRHNLI